MKKSRETAGSIRLRRYRQIVLAAGVKQATMINAIPFDLQSFENVSTRLRGAQGWTIREGRVDED